MLATRRMPARIALLLSLVAIARVPAPSAAADEPQATAAAATAPDIENPVPQLIRDPTVQKELKLTGAQRAKLDAAYAKVAPRLWPTTMISSLCSDRAQPTICAAKASIFASRSRRLPRM